MHLIIDVKGRFVRNIENPSHFACVGQIHCADATGQSDIDLFDGEERKRFGTEIGIGQLGDDGPREGAHDAQGRVERRDVGDVDPTLMARLPAQPRLTPRLLNDGRDHHEVVVRQTSQRTVAFISTLRIVHAWKLKISN